MPRGIKKIVDTNIVSNIIDNVRLPEVNANLTQNDTKINEEQYTSSPDGRYKFLKSEYDSDYLEDRTPTRIPQITREGYTIVWPHDIKAATIPFMRRQGWDFVDPRVPGCEEAAKRIVAGRTETGEIAFHYAMQMRTEDYNAMMSRKTRMRKEKEDNMKLSPSDQSNAIYGTEQMNFSREIVRPK